MASADSSQLSYCKHMIRRVKEVIKLIFYSSDPKILLPCSSSTCNVVIAVVVEKRTMKFVLVKKSMLQMFNEASNPPLIYRS